jgi:hypothetical protein
MARQNGPLQLTGSIGNLSFYHHKEYGYLARQKGGARRGKTSERTRENSNELGRASRTGKLIRRGLRAALHVSGDATVSQRLSGCLYRVLQHDTTSARGLRTVANGLENPEGRQLLRSFDFMKERPLEQVLLTAPVYTENGAFALNGFLPGRDLHWPAGATHVQLQGATVFIDTPADSYTAFGTNVLVLSRGGNMQDHFLEPVKAPIGNGFQLAAIGVVFLQEVSGELVAIGERCVGVWGWNEEDLCGDPELLPMSDTRCNRCTIEDFGI